MTSGVGGVGGVVDVGDVVEEWNGVVGVDVVEEWEREADTVLAERFVLNP